ncbi:transposase IS4 family protein [Thermoanaerobacterium thermosaccharolyticum]|uniref:Transposase IS4 family protein n=1 Tax=Thermoanaerobacterium thermosaccharolyticum TaxID=1517 RepID=A0A223HYL9_THETR|nr:transposase [Thermoanaerobacterium thermosaccharolyticum]AST57487.1 transposase IS4 family protein [Thermoanaerobacterium thermosaccharolyticum]
MNSITQNYQIDNKVSTSIKSFFKKYRISAALRLSNAYKSKGIPVISIFEYLFCMIFTNRSMYMNMLMGTNQAGFKKDTVYRFLNSIHINWIRFTTWLSAQIINETITGLTSDKRVNVLIVDDSLFERSSSKKVELLAKVYDHAKKTYKYGFRLLTLGWSDGNTFLPVNGCLLSTENQKNRINEAITMDKRSAGYLRRNLAQTKATAVVLELIKAAKKAMIPASYVLFDTWFCSPSSLIAIKEMGYDIIAMAKKTSKMHYLYNGIMQPLTAIYKQNRKRRGRSRYLLSVEVSLEKDGKSIPARIVFVRNKNKRKDYLALITTDMNLNEDEIIRIYGKRWDIEVFFKVCKSYLKLSKECNSLSYDAMTAHTAIVFTRYMMLALENRRSSDLRTMGEIFYYIQDEMSDITLIQAFHLLMQVFLDTIADKLSLTSEQLDQLLNAFMAAIPKELKERLPKCA